MNANVEERRAKYAEIEELLRDALKTNTLPMVDTHIRRALLWLGRCGPRRRDARFAHGQR
jgi:hypothetical protein